MRCLWFATRKRLEFKLLSEAESGAGAGAGAGAGLSDAASVAEEVAEVAGACSAFFADAEDADVVAENAAADAEDAFAVGDAGDAAGEGAFVGVVAGVCCSWDPLRDNARLRVPCFCTTCFCTTCWDLRGWAA